MKPEEQLKWYAVDITAAPEAAEAIEHALNEMEALGTEIDLMPRAPVETVNVVGYFNHLPDEEEFRDELHHALRIYDLDESAIISLERRDVVDQDWLLEWKKHWKPSTIGRFIISPPWEAVRDDGHIVIRIEPNMAFGTGTHETTQLCLRTIDEKYAAGDSFLDVGTGTGILAIAAAKVSGDSSTRIFACDTDQAAVAIAIENAQLNDVPKIEFAIGPLSRDTTAFDVVCANLTLDVILPILPLLLERSAKLLILSGILVEQEDAIVSALAKHAISDLEIERLGEWIAVIVPR